MSLSKTAKVQHGKNKIAQRSNNEKGNGKITKTIPKKPREVKQTKPVPEMVQSIMAKNPEGITLQVIRNSLVKLYGAKMTKKFV